MAAAVCVSFFLSFLACWRQIDEELRLTSWANSTVLMRSGARGSWLSPAERRTVESSAIRTDWRNWWVIRVVKEPRLFSYPRRFLLAVLAYTRGIDFERGKASETDWLRYIPGTPIGTSRLIRVWTKLRKFSPGQPNCRSLFYCPQHPTAVE